MQQEQLRQQELAMSPAEYRAWYEWTVQNPTIARPMLEQMMAQTGPMQLNFSDERQTHVRGDISKPVVALANGGCMEFNSVDIFATSIDGTEEHVDVTDGDVSDGPLTLAFTKPGDELIISFKDEQYRQEQLTTLEKIRESFAQIDIELTSDIVQVPSIIEWLKENKPDDLLMQVLSPRILPLIARNDKERYQYQIQGLMNTAMYSKVGFIQYCGERTTEMDDTDDTIPTPRTQYYTFNEDAEAIDQIATHVAQILGEYQHWVVSADKGVAGSGVVKNVDLEALRNGVLPELCRPGETVFVQGQLPLLNKLSPCSRFYLGDSPDEIEFLGVTAQRFLDAEGKTYGGNKWERNFEDKLEELAPGFKDINLSTAIKLQKLGIRGIINLDSLMISQEDMIQLKEKAVVMLREANIRPAMSHFIGRLAQGSINGLPVHRVHTKTEIVVPDVVFNDADFVTKVNSCCDGMENMRVVVGARYPDSNKTYLAFVANENVTEEELNHLEAQILSNITVPAQAVH